MITIKDVVVFEFESHLKRPFATARKVINKNTNYILMITAERDGREFTGFGESAPRGVKMTADPTAKVWRFLTSCADVLTGRSFSDSTAESCVNDVRAAVDVLNLKADELAGICTPRAFRGSIAGVETALLDVCARAMHLRVSELLGQRRKLIRVTATTLSAGANFKAFESRILSQGTRYPFWRIKGDARLKVAVEYVVNISRVNAEQFGSRRGIWIDFNESLSISSAKKFIDSMIDLNVKGVLKGKLILEQPVKKEEVRALCDISAYAKSRSTPTLLIVVMADESLFDYDDWLKIAEAGGVGAVNIKVAKSGGILPSFDLAKAIYKFDKSIEIYLGGMLATTDLTSHSILELARSLPRFDYTTSGVTGNLKTHVSTHPIRMVKGKDSTLEMGEEVGVGTSIDLGRLNAFVMRSYSTIGFKVESVTEDAAEGRLRYGYMANRLAVLGQKDLDSYLLEERAIAYGFKTRRFDPLIFFVDVLSDGQYLLGFWWTGSTLSTKAYNMICGQKQWTRNFLSACGVPTVDGELFGFDEQKRAVEYAASLGWPVVLKPADGSGGRAVTTDIRDKKGLLAAMKALKSGERFLVERFIEGNDYRILVTADKVISVLSRTAAHVIGNGKDTIKTLVKNANLKRMGNPRYKSSLIKLERPTTMDILQKAGLRPDSIVPAGQVLFLSTAANISQGGEGVDVTHETHQTIIDFAMKVRRCLPGLGHIGIDLLIKDHRVSMDKQSYGICEVNAYGEIGMHEFPSEYVVSRTGTPRVSPADEIFRFNCERFNHSNLFASTLVSRRIVCAGVTDKDRFSEWLLKNVQESGMRLKNLEWVSVESRLDCSFTVTGYSGAIALLAATAISPDSSVRCRFVEAAPEKFESQLVDQATLKPRMRTKRLKTSGGSQPLM